MHGQMGMHGVPATVSIDFGIVVLSSAGAAELLRNRASRGVRFRAVRLVIPIWCCRRDGSLDLDTQVVARDDDRVAAHVFARHGRLLLAVQSSNIAPCHGQVTQSSSTKPSESGPPSCGQVSSMAWNFPSLLNTAMRRPATSKARASPDGMSVIVLMRWSSMSGSG